MWVSGCVDAITYPPILYPLTPLGQHPIQENIRQTLRQVFHRLG